MYIISARPGACSDIVSSVIDSTDSHLLQKGQIYFTQKDRKLLKYPNIDVSNVYAKIEASTYKSISSQYSKIINQQDIVNQYITVDITDDYSFDWCMARLQILYPRLIFERNKLKNEVILHRDYADHIINLQDVLSGNLIKVLSKYVPTKLNEELYNDWLNVVLKRFPYSFV